MSFGVYGSVKVKFDLDFAYCIWDTVHGAVQLIVFFFQFFTNSNSVCFRQLL